MTLVLILEDFISRSLQLSGGGLLDAGLFWHLEEDNHGSQDYRTKNLKLTNRSKPIVPTLESYVCADNPLCSN